MAATATTNGSGEATLTFSTAGTAVPVAADLFAPQLPAATGTFTTWTVDLTLTSASDGSPVPGVNVFLGMATYGQPLATTDASGAATVQFKVFASANQALPILVRDSAGSAAGKIPVPTGASSIAAGIASQGKTDLAVVYSL